MSRPRCFRCFRQLAYTRAGMVYAVRNINGTAVRMHKDCAQRYDDERARDPDNFTAAESEAGQYSE